MLQGCEVSALSFGCYGVRSDTDTDTVGRVYRATGDVIHRPPAPWVFHRDFSLGVWNGVEERELWPDTLVRLT